MKYPNHIPNMVKDVNDFIALSGAELIVPPMARPFKETIALCKALINEEVNEELFPLLDKLANNQYSLEIMAEVLDAYIDTMYVSIWGCIVLNLPVNAAWNEVQKANMAKFPKHGGCSHPEEGCGIIAAASAAVIPGKVVDVYCKFGRLVTTDVILGKVCKPPEWKAPELWDLLYRTWTIVKLQHSPDVIIDKNFKTLSES